MENVKRPFSFRHPEKMEGVRRHLHDSYKKQGKNVTGPALEAACFKAVPFGNPMKGEFNISLAMIRWPFLYLEKDGIENFWFTRMCRALCTYKRVFLVGSASAGKSMGMAVTGYNFWGVNPTKTNFIVTSTDKESLDAKIWGAVRDLQGEDRLKIGVRVDYADAIVMGTNKQGQDMKANERDIRDAIKAIALPKGSEGEKAIGKVQGRKNENIIWACDEYAHMDAFVKGARANLASAPMFLFWAASNKPEEGDPMYNDAMPDPDKYPMGWEHPGLSDMEMWETKGGGVCLYFDGEKSPNTHATGKDDPFPMLTRRDYIANVLAEEGEDGYGYWKYVRAFPKSGQTHDKLLDSRFLERYHALDEAVWSNPNWTVVCGLDAAWTKGGDSCMADFGKVGVDNEGLKILSHETDAVKLNTRVSGIGTFEEQLSVAFLDECQKRDCHVVAIDISGSGGRLANPVISEAAKRKWKLEVIAVDSAGSPDDKQMYDVGSIQKNGKELFKKRVDEVWVSYRLSIQKGLIRGMKLTSKACRELCDRRINTDEDKRWVIESKDKYKERNQGRSPDSGEARVLCHQAARKHGLGASVIPKQTSQRVSLGILTQEEKPKSAYAWEKAKSAYSW